METKLKITIRRKVGLGRARYEERDYETEGVLNYGNTRLHISQYKFLPDFCQTFFFRASFGQASHFWSEALLTLYFANLSTVVF